METDEDIDNNVENSEDTGLKVSFMCVVFVQESIVTGTNDGYVNLLKK